MTKATHTRIALGVQYEGGSYHGWQAQANFSSVQQHVETALSCVADEPIVVMCAGRTDTGVHATYQVIHFETTKTREGKAWVLGSNTHLPRDIRIQWAQVVSDDFHARFSATARRYRYIIYNGAVPTAILANGLTFHPYRLDCEKMQAAANYFLGEQDFSAVRAAGCQSKSSFRNVHNLQVWRHNDFVVIDITANAFLYHMVRNIAGVLIPIGEGRQSPDWAEHVLQSRDRCQAGVTAPAQGLYLVDVSYPEFQLPLSTLGPLWLEIA